MQRLIVNRDFGTWMENECYIRTFSKLFVIFPPPNLELQLHASMLIWDICCVIHVMVLLCLEGDDLCMFYCVLLCYACIFFLFQFQLMGLYWMMFYAFPLFFSLSQCCPRHLYRHLKSNLWFIDTMALRFCSQLFLDFSEFQI